MVRKMRLRAQCFRDDKLQTVELYGPSDIETWSECDACQETALVMWDAVDLINLQDYAQKITRYHTRYGIATYGLLYQTDVRARQERLPVWVRMGPAAVRRSAVCRHPGVMPL